jgi:hypothetical protein
MEDFPIPGMDTQATAKPGSASGTATPAAHAEPRALGNKPLLGRQRTMRRCFPAPLTAACSEANTGSLYTAQRSIRGTPWLVAMTASQGRFRWQCASSLAVLYSTDGTQVQHRSRSGCDARRTASQALTQGARRIAAGQGDDARLERRVVLATSARPTNAVQNAVLGGFEKAPLPLRIRATILLWSA